MKPNEFFGLRTAMSRGDRRSFPRLPTASRKRCFYVVIAQGQVYIPMDENFPFPHMKTFPATMFPFRTRTDALHFYLYQSLVQIPQQASKERASFS